MKKSSKFIIIMAIVLLFFSALSNLQNALYFEDITQNIEYTTVTNLSENESAIKYETAKYKNYNNETIPQEIKNINFYNDNNILLFKLIVTENESVIGISINGEIKYYEIL